VKSKKKIIRPHVKRRKEGKKVTKRKQTPVANLAGDWFFIFLQFKN
jgi:uncharacterized membrane protein